MPANLEKAGITPATVNKALGHLEQLGIVKGKRRDSSQIITFDSDNRGSVPTFSCCGQVC